MINSEKFNKIISKFEKDEGRGMIYWRAKELISKNVEFDMEAILLLLTTWNFAHMSTLFKKARGKQFNYKSMKKSIEEVKPYLEKVFKNEAIKTANLIALQKDIKKVFQILQTNNQIKSVGASKVLMLLNDEFFVAWDNAIINYYSKKQPRGKKLRKKDGKVDGESYYLFLELMKKEFSHIKLNEKNSNIESLNQKRGFAKAIDEFNYITLRRTKKKSK